MAKDFYELKHEETNEKILRASKKLLLQHGFSDVNMSMVAEASLLSRQRLYAYFENLDEIIYRIQINDMRNFITFFNERLKDEEFHGKDRLVHCLNEMFLYEDKHTDDFVFTAYFDVYYHKKTVRPRLENEYKKLYDGSLYFQLVAEAIEEGKRTGEFKDSVDSAGTVYMFGNLTQMLLERIAFFKSSKKEKHNKDELERLKNDYCEAMLGFLEK
ncbi:MAG: TetR/AcrR family transcriptional regulator [Bacilli bacterium]|jgi:AcrR family transcriptional regulator|nr:TetR/AcrR family transcriptional regulator [Bacilli bacterium]MCH4210229.1 TetR/AcrR family transcriptional regulator [Bacilli bacterium]MCH4228411.1 TetR/AcrR family transcriptional regulator [Bacilli bacterium]MCH4278037.1 TetR/AcrR family transcriptional regulator [Bacilli bacterium]MCI2054910.1 TetR/AcrR family transcriptional regulator [Bacilli bacterium]